jgi:hypothetical protein
MQALRFKALMVQAVICSEDESVMSAEIYGIGSVDGQGEFEYQIKLEDQGEPGTDDKYGSSSRASHITRATSNSREERPDPRNRHVLSRRGGNLEGSGPVARSPRLIGSDAPAD